MQWPIKGGVPLIGESRYVKALFAGRDRSCVKHHLRPTCILPRHYRHPIRSEFEIRYHTRYTSLLGSSTSSGAGTFR